MESKADKFRRLRDARLPKAIKAIELLGNLSGANYEYTPQEAAEVVEAMYEAVGLVAEQFGAERASARQVGTVPEPKRENAPEPPPPQPPSDTPTIPCTFEAEGGTIAINEIRWAHDAARAGDHKLAYSRLHRILKRVNDSVK